MNSRNDISPDTDRILRVPAKKLDNDYVKFLRRANLYRECETEAWTVLGTNTAINYSTHGVYRYFGKFPAPIGKQLIREYSLPNELVIDPACGSGTTGVEALLEGRAAQLYDVNPLSVLISKVKTTQLSERSIGSAIENFSSRYRKTKVRTFQTDEIDLEHWFLPETIADLARIRSAIAGEENVQLRNFLTMVFSSIIRRTSKATTQQGRLFLDVDTAVENVFPVFLKQVEKTGTQVALLPKSKNIKVKQASLLDGSNYTGEKASLVIYHPPYFNAYKYSSINSLEMAWLDFPRKDTRREEIREFFKVGKPENADVYVADMVKTLQNSKKFLKKDGRLCMMIGDALMKDQHIPVTAQILDQISDDFQLERVILRIPKYTEATWASSQRRTKNSLGITMFDYIVTLKAV